jgi:large subunit ribosomal protein L15
MGLNNLVAAGGRKKRKRVGRGPGSGHGGTSGRGNKGQLSRTGASMRATFEGGQMPLQRRLPKRGFKNPFRKVFQVVNLGDLNRFDAGSVVDPQVLGERGLIRRADRPVKILSRGELDRALTVKAQAFSQKARQKIEAAGGRAELIAQAAGAAS